MKTTNTHTQPTAYAAEKYNFQPCDGLVNIGAISLVIYVEYCLWYNKPDVLIISIMPSACQYPCELLYPLPH